MLRRMADYIELGTRLDPPSLHELEFKSDLMSDINTDGRTRTDGTKMNLRPTNQVTAVDAHAHTDSVGG